MKKNMRICLLVGALIVTSALLLSCEETATETEQTTLTTVPTTEESGQAHTWEDWVVEREATKTENG